MMPATKHFDPVLGIDVHIVQPPGPVPPVPIPHPFVGIISDPMDYVPIVGATVKINGLPRGLAGTQGIATPPHIPIGGVFVKPPANECECFMGVSTINCDGDALCHMTLPVLSCQCIGMPPIPRMRKKGAIKSLVLPTSVVLSIPAGPPVLIAGPPTISLMALGMRAGMGALGKAFKKFKASKLGKKASSKVDNLKSKFKKKTPSANKGCGRPGEPVDVVSGANVDDFIDWESPQLPHFRWQRFYSTLMAPIDGPLGFGFRHNWQHELEKTARGFAYRDAEGETVEFPPLDPETSVTTNDGFVLRLEDSGRYQLSAALQPIMWFGREDRRTMCAQEVLIDGEHVVLKYDDSERLASLSDTRGNQWRLAYDRQGHIARVSLFTEHQEQTLVQYSYDEAGRLAVWKDALDHAGRYEYDPQHRMTKKTDRNGYSYHYTYDELGRCSHSWGDDGLYEIQLEYQPDDGRTVVHWADGARYEYFYDEQGVLAKIIDPTGGVTLFTADDTGNIVQEIEPNGDEVEYLYDQYGAHTRRVDASGQVLLPMQLEPHRPDGLGYILPDTPVGWMLGKVASAQEVAANAVEQLLQHVGLEAVGSGVVPEAWEFQPPTPKLDALGRVCEEVDIAANKTTYSTDANGNVTRRRNGDGAIWSFQYKSWNLLDEERDPLGATTKYDYNLREAVTRVIDPGGTETEYEYDACDRVITVIRGGKVRDRYAYAANGAIREKHDAAGNLLLRFEPGPYDTYAKLELSDGGSFSYQHTEHARIACVAGSDHMVNLEYDSFDHVKLDVRNGKGVQYDWDASQTTIQTILGAYCIQYCRLPEGLTEIIDPAGGKLTIASDGRGRFVRKSDDGLAELVSYDQRGLCLNKVVTLPDKTNWIRTYAYSIGRDLTDTTDSRTGHTEYQYDTAHRLIALRRSGRDSVYSHDGAGNLLAKPGLSSVRIGQSNQLEIANDETFSYNDRGHISQRVRPDGTSQRYQYNSLDQLVEIKSEDGLSWSANYDGLNRRISKEWTVSYQSHRVEFYWDHRRLAAEVRDGQRLRIYVYGDRESFVPLMMVDYDSVTADPATGRRYQLLSDQRGQIVEVIDSLGRAVWRAQAAPYGEVSPDAVDGFEFNLRLPGQYADDETGLQACRYRYFDSALGRFIQSDPIGLAGGMNVYAYPSNPLTRIDLEGLHPDGPSKSGGGGDGPKAKEAPPTTKTPTKTPLSPEDKALQEMGTFKGKKRKDIQRQLRDQGYKSRKNGNSKIYTKDLGNGNTAAVRLDPATKRIPSKGFADEVPHAHKEIVPTSQVDNGKYFQPNKASGVKKFDDAGVQSADPAAIHIPISTRK